MDSSFEDRISNSRWVGIAIFVAAALSQLPTFDRSIVPMDEGHLAALSMGLREGKLLYRDLHTGIFPGIYHITAGLFGLFGDDLIVTRWAEVLVNAGIATCLWLAGIRMELRGWALVAPLLYMALIPMSFPVLAMFNYSSLALGLAMLSLYLTLRYLDAGERNVAIALGACLALTVFCKQNFGAFAFVALLASLLLNRRDSVLAERSWSAVLLPVALAGIAVTLGFAGHLALTGTFGDFVRATVIQIGGDQMESFNNPIPPILGAHPEGDSRFTFLHLPPYVFNKLIHGEAILGSPVGPGMRSAAIRLSYGVPIAALLASPAVWFLGSRGESARARRGARTGVIFALLFFLGIFPSAVWSHLAFVLPPVLLLIGTIASQCEGCLRTRSVAAAAGVRAIAATLVGCALSVAVLASLDVARWHPSDAGLARASLRVTPEQAQIYQGAVDFIEECAAPDEAVFVAPYMPILYFLTQRSNVSHYDLTIPGDVRGAQIIHSLETAQTRCIVYNPVMYPEFPPFPELFPELSGYLQSHYHGTRRIRGGGEMWIGMMRNEDD